MVCHILKVKRALDMTKLYDNAIMFKIFINRKHHQYGIGEVALRRAKCINIVSDIDIAIQDTNISVLVSNIVQLKSE